MAMKSNDWIGCSLSGDRYVVKAKLGAGGMGIVDPAVDSPLGTNVVIKLPRPAMLEDHVVRRHVLRIDRRQRSSPTGGVARTGAAADHPVVRRVLVRDRFLAGRRFARRAPRPHVGGTVGDDRRRAVIYVNEMYPATVRGKYQAYAIVIGICGTPVTNLIASACRADQ